MRIMFFPLLVVRFSKSDSTGSTSSGLVACSVRGLFSSVPTQFRAIKFGRVATATLRWSASCRRVKQWRRVIFSKAKQRPETQCVWSVKNRRLGKAIQVGQGTVSVRIWLKTTVCPSQCTFTHVVFIAVDSKYHRTRSPRFIVSSVLSAQDRATEHRLRSPAQSLWPPADLLAARGPSFVSSNHAPGGTPSHCL